MQQSDIAKAGIKTQELIARTLDLQWLEALGLLNQVDAELWELYREAKADRNLVGEGEYYIWHTQGDERVRGAHAANDGKIFSRENPPETGNPGDDYNCRCWAEPYKKGQTEFVQQDLLPIAPDSEKWTTSDFLRHFWFGGGQIVTLPQIGHLLGVIDYYFYHIIRKGKNTYDRLNQQIIDVAREQGAGHLNYDFKNSYKEFGDYYWVFGGGTVKGEFNGSVYVEDEMMFVEGQIDFRYIDTFTDIASIRQEVINVTSEPLESNVLELLLTDFGGVFFDIVGTWQTSFKAEIKVHSEESRF